MVAGVLALTDCIDANADRQQRPAEITLELGRGIIMAQVADTPASRERGMMERKRFEIDKGMARIADFGITLLLDRELLTETGIGLGTSCFMSPEPIQHPKGVDSRSDIYSAGILLYEMLTGDVPFDGETDFSIKQRLW